MALVDGDAQSNDRQQRGGNAMSEQSSGSNGRMEEFQVRGEELLAKVKELIHEGNVRRIVIADEDGETIIEFPVTVGVVGALLLPPLAAVGAVAAVVANCTIRVDRKGEPGDAQ
jgi:hypothetical protein